MSTEEILPPINRKLEVALRSIGYTFESAVADIIDNSIDARALSVLVRIYIRKDGQLDLFVWDDGHGMAPDTLRDAMRFGADVSNDIDRLGKFGLGLKLASLSQAREVQVVTRKDGKISGREWPEHGIAQGFVCKVFDEEECFRLVHDAVPERPLERSGTIVKWSNLYRLRRHQDTAEEFAQKLLKRLENFLSIAFHRFLSGRPRKLTITLDVFDQHSNSAGLPVQVRPLDPFGYDRSGNPAFPLQMSVDGPYSDRIKVIAHIWPPNSTAPAYRLPGGANSRQGFYFYRNNRLIQAGGWNGIREAEPHSSLARLEVDIAAELDVDVSLDVKKMEIQLPPDLAKALLRAQTTTGIDFKKYISIANDAYRKRAVTDGELPLIPSGGLPATLVTFLHKELRIKATTKHHDLKIGWRKLDNELFFDIDRDGGNLYINQAYRKQLQHGLAGSSADVPVLKCLLFLVLEDALSSERMGAKMRERLEQINRILVRAVRFERSPE
ncbi:ATP-binding protein [Bradyrhizobium sp. PUT101]|uniref:ATP-binding protein n=1 Tax=Bradyrhizobium sp. PUT101 TaxID=3447427 RepID=UPI003F827DFC